MNGNGPGDWYGLRGGRESRDALHRVDQSRMALGKLTGFTKSTDRSLPLLHGSTAVMRYLSKDGFGTEEYKNAVLALAKEQNLSIEDADAMLREHIDRAQEMYRGAWSDYNRSRTKELLGAPFRAAGGAIGGLLGYHAAQR